MRVYLPSPCRVERSLADLWANSPAFNAFRGTAWMKEPCAACPRRELDFGGCRRQAFALTGDATATDPVCHLAPDHARVQDLAAFRIDAPYDQAALYAPRKTTRPIKMICPSLFIRIDLDCVDRRAWRCFPSAPLGAMTALGAAVPGATWPGFTNSSGAT
jgi:hypothetical protein